MTRDSITKISKTYFETALLLLATSYLVFQLTVRTTDEPLTWPKETPLIETNAGIKDFFFKYNNL
jgi:hypothetical protein